MKQNMGQTGSSKISIFTQWTVKVEDIDRPQGLGWYKSSSLKFSPGPSPYEWGSQSVANHIVHIT